MEIRLKRPRGPFLLAGPILNFPNPLFPAVLSRNSESTSFEAHPKKIQFASSLLIRVYLLPISLRLLLFRLRISLVKIDLGNLDFFTQIRYQTSSSLISFYDFWFPWPFDWIVVLSVFFFPIMSLFLVLILLLYFTAASFEFMCLEASLLCLFRFCWWSSCVHSSIRLLLMPQFQFI